MTSEEMFKKLGYVKVENDPITYHRVFYDMIEEIKFSQIDKSFIAGIYRKESNGFYEIFASIVFRKKLLLAITQQMKELGWLD